MNKEKLIHTASQLGPFDPRAAADYAKAAGALTARLNQTMLARLDIEALTGKENLTMMQDNHANHARFISSLLIHFQPEVLVETILWVFRAYRSRGFASTYWAAQINEWIHLLPQELPEESHKNILPLYEWIQVNIPLFELCAKDTQHGAE